MEAPVNPALSAKLSDRRCGAKRRDGKTCLRWPSKGRTRCPMHGGTSPGAPLGNQRGIRTYFYAKSLPPEEVPFHEEAWELLGSLDNELALLRGKLRWALSKMTESPMAGPPTEYGGRIVKVRLWIDIVNEYADAIRRLETARDEMAKEGDEATVTALTEMMAKIRAGDFEHQGIPAAPANDLPMTEQPKGGNGKAKQS